MKLFVCCALVLLFIAHGIAHGEQSAAVTFRPLASNGENAAEALGVWGSRGYGWILDLQARSLTVYHISRAGCSMDPRTTNFDAQFAYRSSDSSSQVLTLSSYPGENRY